LHVFLWQKYYHQDIRYTIQTSHLWFLANIFIYVILLSPLFIYLKNHKKSQFSRAIHKLFSGLYGILFVVAAFVLESVLVHPNPFELYANTWHGFVLGFLAFFFGFCIMMGGNSFWKILKQYRWVIISVATILFISRMTRPDFVLLKFLLPVESVAWIFSVLGFAYRNLNVKTHSLRYLSEGAYPIYILHMSFLYLGAFFVLPLNIPVSVKFILVLIITFAGSLLVYEMIVRRVNFFRMAFGIKLHESRRRSNSKIIRIFAFYEPCKH